MDGVEKCPHCNSKLIEDVWELIHEEENGNLVQEIIYPALICSNYCGYYQRLREDDI
ncbi:hypothetical protein [Bacillus timonensis]|uniref:hypothetical protein n=1 Tax=Bacillus timonensis TaxID=1033734 RepID=UPI0012B5159D|nr:hypothetical protein [Bacillus timonensis]